MYRILRHIAAFAAAVVTASPALGGEPSGTDAPAKRLAGVVASKLPRNAGVGIAVYDLRRRRLVYAHNPDALIALASNAKIFTTAAALTELGPDYEFKTQLIAAGAIAGDALKGDLVVRGGGDPNISGRFHGGDRMAVPREWAKAVREAGIRAVTGDLVADDTFFDREWILPDWPKDQLLWWYCAPVGALSFNDNCVDVVITGGARAGSRPTLRIEPSVAGISLDNDCRTVAARGVASLRFQRLGEPLAFRVSGTIGVGTSRAENLTLTDPSIFLLTAFAHELRRQGVEVRGKLRTISDREPELPRRVLHVSRSRLAESIQIANKRSQNFYAEQILKTLAAEKLGRGTFADGVRALAAFHRRIGLPPDHAELVDGSGLSRRNRARATAVVHVLAWMAQGPNAAVFRDSFAVTGVDGTLRHRLHDPACRGRIAGKTGTIAGVSALSGYVRAPDGDYAFSVLCDGLNSGGGAPARALQDAVCRAILGAP